MGDATSAEPHAPASSQTASLVRRLAGPSSGKAGLAKDQTEINRIIAEASKGSKFYENEKRKDKELTEKIEQLLKQRDAMMKDVDVAKIEQGVDKLLAEIEAHRDLTQYIVHVDMDAFYASVELLDHPELAGKPFGVGHGVLTTASYEARKYGVRSGMASFVAKKLCPDLILVSNHFNRYSEMSGKVMAIFRQYDPTMLPAGCDEGYLNITAYCEANNVGPDECVEGMRKQVFEETKLTVSAGIAPNKMLAKICSDKNKPNGQYHLPFTRAAVMDFTRDLSIRKIPGIGRVNERLLESIGIKTCGDIYAYRSVLSVMDKTFGLHGLLRIYLGIGSNVVQPHQRDERKSIGAERTFGTLSDKEKILQKLDEVAAELESDMERTGWAGKTVTLKYKLDTYQVFTRAKSTDRWITKKEDLLAIGEELLKPEWPLKLRLIGLRVTKLKDLRAPEPSSGIKRFLKPISQGEGASDHDPSPRKRHKVDHNMDETEPLVYDDQEEADENPAFFASDDDDPEIKEDLLPSVNGASSSLDHERMMRPRFGPRPTTKPSSLSDTAPSASTRQATSSSTPNLSSTRPSQLLTCPICTRELETDNDGLNTHIDFCLSKTAIREATRDTSVSPKKNVIQEKAQSPVPKAAGWDALFKPPYSGTLASRKGTKRSRGK